MQRRLQTAFAVGPPLLAACLLVMITNPPATNAATKESMDGSSSSGVQRTLCGMVVQDFLRLCVLSTTMALLRPSLPSSLRTAHSAAGPLSVGVAGLCAVQVAGLLTDLICWVPGSAGAIQSKEANLQGASLRSRRGWPAVQ